MLQTKVVEKIKTHFVFSNFLFFENHAGCMIMWENIVVWGWAQATILRMSIAFWISKATQIHAHTLRICNIYCFSIATMDLSLFIFPDEPRNKSCL